MYRLPNPQHDQLASPSRAKGPKGMTLTCPKGQVLRCKFVTADPFGVPTQALQCWCEATITMGKPKPLPDVEVSCPSGYNLYYDANYDAWMCVCVKEYCDLPFVAPTVTETGKGGRGLKASNPSGQTVSLGGFAVAPGRRRRPPSRYSRLAKFFS